MYLIGLNTRTFIYSEKAKDAHNAGPVVGKREQTGGRCVFIKPNAGNSPRPFDLRVTSLAIIM